MTRAYLAFTDTGLALAKRLADALPGAGHNSNFFI